MSFCERGKCGRYIHRVNLIECEQADRVMTGNEDSEFPYLVEPAIHIFWGIIGATGAVAFGTSGFTEKRGLILDGIFLPPPVATAFYWIMCAVLSGLALLTVCFAIQARLRPRRISLTQNSVSIPRSRWTPRTKSIPYASISDFAQVKLRGHGFLYVTHASGRSIVTSAGFKSAADYVSFCQMLIAARHAPSRDGKTWNCFDPARGQAFSSPGDRGLDSRRAAKR